MSNLEDRSGSFWVIAEIKVHKEYLHNPNIKETVEHYVKARLEQLADDVTILKVVRICAEPKV